MMIIRLLRNNDIDKAVSLLSKKKESRLYYISIFIIIHIIILIVLITLFFFWISLNEFRVGGYVATIFLSWIFEFIEILIKISKSSDINIPNYMLAAKIIIAVIIIFISFYYYYYVSFKR